MSGPARPGGPRIAFAARRRVGAIPMRDLPDGARVVLPYPPFHVLVVNLGGAVHALEDACNHAGQSLAEGTIERGCISCPAHGYVFDVATGALVTPRGLCDPQRTFDVDAEGDDWVVYDPFVDVVVASNTSST